MGTDFSRILTLLRKEKNKSQKQTAQELGISQALLSHYEKGIRKPGLEFLVHCADYYDVSCDYLLGRSPDPQGAILTVQDLPENDSERGNQGVESVLTQLHKKLLANSQSVLFDLLAKVGHKGLTGDVASYLMLACYRMFRIVYSSNPKNSPAMFGVPEQAYSAYTDATMQILEAQAKSIVAGNPIENLPKIRHPEKHNTTTESLMAEYPLQSSSLLNLIQTAENRIGFQKK